MKIKDLKDLELIRDIFQETDLVVEDTNHDPIEDKKIKCKDCGKEFIFTVGEQQFYKSKSFPFPKHCHSCAKERRRKFLNYK